MNTSPEKEKLDLDNAQRAFAHKSDKALMRMYRLYKKIDSPFLTKVGPPLVTFALKVGLPLEGLIKRTIFDIFCGGTSLKDTTSRSEDLYSNGVQTILDYSVEGRKSDAGFDDTRDELIRTIQHGAQHEAVAFSALKLTGIVLFEHLVLNDATDPITDDVRAALLRGKKRLDDICRVAADLRQPVFIDAEETWIQDSIDRWSEEAMEKYNKETPVVYTTVQMYRHDRLEYLRGLIRRSREKGYVLGVKVVRGAYLEKENERAGEMRYPTPMQPNKAATDRDYNAALALCVENVDNVAICAGTHNAGSCQYLAGRMAEKGLPNDHPHILFSQLLGMSDIISFNLAWHGYNVAKYLPYGPVRDVLPYLFRRADENTAIAGQSSREVKQLRREAKRRGLL